MDLDLKETWLVDRSRINAGRTHCKRRRYLEFHSGPFGYGIRAKTESLPLVTGQAVHTIVSELLKLPGYSRGDANEQRARAIINAEHKRYQARVAARGFMELTESDEQTQAEIRRIVIEQSALIEALGWAAALYWVPQLLEEHRPILIEEELLLPLGDNVVLMNRPDTVLERKIDATLAQYEFKTVGGYLNFRPWRRQWEDNSQLLLTRLAVERYVSQPVTFAYVYAFDKGKRSAEKRSGLLKQWSPFLYAYHKEANPPYWAEDWQLRWEWVDEQGQNRRLGKGYERKSLFDFPFPGRPPEMSPIEYWIRALPEEEVTQQREILGPFTFLDHVAESIVEGIVSEELEWQEKLWRIHKAGEAVEWNEAHPDFIKVLDQEVPQSWFCHPYGKDCQFLPICRREPGWEDPLGGGRYESRRPHHATEIQQAAERGIELPLEEEDEEELGEE